MLPSVGTEQLLGLLNSDRDPIIPPDSHDPKDGEKRDGALQAKLRVRDGTWGRLSGRHGVMSPGELGRIR